jgi:hypothetical protein
MPATKTREAALCLKTEMSLYPFINIYKRVYTCIHT